MRFSALDRMRYRYHTHMMKHGILDIDIVDMIYVMVYDIYTLRYKHEFFSVWMLTRNILTDRSDTNLPVLTVSKWLGNDKMTSAGYILEEKLRENCCYFIFSRSYALHCRAKKSQSQSEIVHCFIQFSHFPKLCSEMQHFSLRLVLVIMCLVQSSSVSLGM